MAKTDTVIFVHSKRAQWYGPRTLKSMSNFCTGNWNNWANSNHWHTSVTISLRFIGENFIFALRLKNSPQVRFGNSFLATKLRSWHFAICDWLYFAVVGLLKTDVILSWKLWIAWLNLHKWIEMSWLPRRRFCKIECECLQQCLKEQSIMSTDSWFFLWTIDKITQHSLLWVVGLTDSAFQFVMFPHMIYSSLYNAFFFYSSFIHIHKLSIGVD